MNKKIEKYTKLIESNIDILKDNYKVKNIGLFGSLVREEQTAKSDVDIMIEFSASVGLFHFIRLKNFLGDILNCKVDLVQKGAMKPYIEKQVLKELIMVYE